MNSSKLIGLSESREDRTKIPKATWLIMETANSFGVKLEDIDPRKVEFEFTPQGVIPYFNERDLLELNTLITRRTRGLETQCHGLATALESQGIKCVDPSDSLVYPSEKLYFQVQRGGKFAPKSAFLNSSEGLEKTLERLDLEIGNFIVKPQRGTRKEGFVDVRTQDDYKKVLGEYSQTPLIVQERIDLEDEFRAIVVGDRCLGLARDDPLSPTNYKEFVRDDDIEKIALEISKLHSHDVLGIDIGVGKDERIVVFEANRNPNFYPFQQVAEGRVNVANEIVAYALKEN